MSIAVTAASGQLGRAVVRALIAHPDAPEVVGLARTPAKAADLGIEVRPGDYNEPEQLADSLRGVDAVLLVSGLDPPSCASRSIATSSTPHAVRACAKWSTRASRAPTRTRPSRRSSRATGAPSRTCARAA